MQTILMIDDDESLRDTVGLLLENEGYKPLLVGDGVAGLDTSADGTARSHPGRSPNAAFERCRESANDCARSE
ncbi:MAG: hypothetical protein WDO18_01595 [Acidobacteriota bacterium]